MQNLEASAPSLSVFTTLSQDTNWQNQLRRSVSLYLALGNQPINTRSARELEKLLQHTEEELLHYLLQGERPTPTTIEHAKRVLDMAQNSLLQAEVEKQQVPTTNTTDAAPHAAVSPTTLRPTPHPGDNASR